MATLTTPPPSPSLPATPPRVSVADYLDLEWAAEQAGGRSREFVDGKVREMPGPDWNHNIVVGNVGVAVGYRLRGQPFAICGSQMRVRVAERGPYYYPDVAVSPVPAAVVRDRGESLTNPVAVFEVLSPSTESIDRGEKLANYGRIASLVDYLVIDPDAVRVDHCVKQADGSWNVTIHEALVATVRLVSVGTDLPLAEIYDRLFPAATG